MKYFTYSELVRSDTAQRLGIQNHPRAEHSDNLVALVENVLDPAREALGMPIRVTSGYRSPQLNRAVKGAPNSQHMQGQACDLVCADNRQLFEYIRDHLEFDQLINEYDFSWVHVSYKRGGGNRKQVLKIGSKRR